MKTIFPLSVLCFALFGLAEAQSCPKFFQKFSVPLPALEKDALSLGENDYGPTLEGLSFPHIQGKPLFFHARLNHWCFEAEGKANCDTLHTNRLGELGSGNNLSIKNEKGKILVFIYHEGNDLIIQARDLKKPWDDRKPKTAVDRTRPYLQIRPMVTDNPDGTVTSSLEVRAIDDTQKQVLGQFRHELQGPIDTFGKIKRPIYRDRGAKNPQLEAKAAQPESLVGREYHGPEKCGFGQLERFAKTKL